ncbi:MAG TPA: YbjQ family protein [Syntrophomonadaceae bacterium]|nr:YbjQ family protein [Syntrophomonadaceae bacterium]
MILSTTESITGWKIIEIKGLVRGSSIRSKHLGKDIGAALKSLVGGELKGYSELLEESREEALQRMIEDAERQGANAVIALRFSSSQIMNGAAEILAYGTAVRIEK